MTTITPNRLEMSTISGGFQNPGYDSDENVTLSVKESSRKHIYEMPYAEYEPTVNSHAEITTTENTAGESSLAVNAPQGETDAENKSHIEINSEIRCLKIGSFFRIHQKIYLHQAF